MKVLFFAALVAAAQAVDYTVTVTTGTVSSASSNGWFYAAALDLDGNMLNLGLLDNPDKDDFESGNTDVFKFSIGVDLQKIACLIIRAGNPDRSTDAWMIDSASITSSTDDKGVTGKNTDNIWVSADTSEAQLGLMFCADRTASLVNRK